MGGGRTRLVVAASVVLAGAGIVALLVIWSVEGVDRASVWGTVFASAAILAGTAVAVWTLVETVRISHREDASNKAPARYASQAPQPTQKIIASGQGSTAQGAMFGDVITHAELPGGTDLTHPEPHVENELPEHRRGRNR